MLKVTALAILLGACAGTGTAMQNNMPAPFGGPTTGRRGQPDDFRHLMEAQRLRMANTERQKQMTREAAQLLDVASDLQHEAQSSGSNATEQEMLRQIDTIEKLAHNVKERMKGATR
jgi:hypothetical protein